MGTDFKAPLKKDKEQWQKVRLLSEAGVRFFPRWPTGTPGPRPATLNEVRAFLGEFNPPSEGERLIQHPIARKTAHPPREDRLVQKGQFPYQSYSLLGELLASDTVLELFEDSAWQLVIFISRGPGTLSQPYVRFACGNRWSTRMVFLTDQHRLRWPPK